MDRTEIVMTVFYQGAVIVNDATIVRDYGDCLLVSVDLKSMFVRVGCTGGGGNASGPSVGLYAYEDTMRLDESKDHDEQTIIEFPEYVGWNVFSYYSSGDTLDITLLAPISF